MRIPKRPESPSNSQIENHNFQQSMQADIKEKRPSLNIFDKAPASVWLLNSIHHQPQRITVTLKRSHPHYNVDISRSPAMTALSAPKLRP